MYNKRHGSAYDRGSADAYYRRGFRPHMFEGATYSSREIPESEMSKEDIEDYTSGYEEQIDSGDFKDWG